MADDDRKVWYLYHAETYPDRDRLEQIPEKLHPTVAFGGTEYGLVAAIEARTRTDVLKMTLKAGWENLPGVTTFAANPRPTVPGDAVVGSRDELRQFMPTTRQDLW